MTLDALHHLNQIEARLSVRAETVTRMLTIRSHLRMQVRFRARGDGDRQRTEASDRRAYGAQPGASSLANDVLAPQRLVKRASASYQAVRIGARINGTNPGADIRDGLTNKCRRSTSRLPR